LLQNKENFLMTLKEEIKYKSMEEKLQEKNLQEKIQNFKIILTKEICAEIPNAFWERKKHIVNLPYEQKKNLPYEPNFDEKNIPTRSREIQMNEELTNHCKKEIQDLINKITITPKERSITFADKFPDEVKDKKQLQTFLRSLNYVANFYKDLAKDSKHLFDRKESTIMVKNPNKSYLLNKKFLVRVYCKVAKYVLLKIVKNLASKHIFAR
ncbi:LOW QUALITY PROTEIN: hypothetical protein CFOL_v3_11631, partial [Cephalotus follicularis]